MESEKRSLSPRKRKRTRIAGNDTGTNPQVGRLGKRNVLIVDDDADQRAVFQALLASKGFTVHTASTAKEGLGVLKSSPVDIILCDVMMPDISGDRFVKHIRKSSRFSNVPVIMLTSGGKDMEMDCLATGADMFCEKDKACKTLLAQMKMLL